MEEKVRGDKGEEDKEEEAEEEEEEEDGDEEVELAYVLHSERYVPS